MGRPLYTSILLARSTTQAAQPEPPKPTYPVVEKWSRWNAFDPDSDEFFEADNAVYEAFLSEEEIAERAQAQHRESARLLAERLLREADNSLPMMENSDRSAVEAIVAARLAAGEMAVDVETVTSVVEGNASPHGRRSGDNVQETQEGAPAEGQPPRRQPRRAPPIAEWRMSSTGEISPAPVDAAVPRISIVPVGSRENQRRTLSRSPSPDPSNLVFGLRYLSDSPRPLIPIGSPPRPISPIPNTPARVSGVFSTPPPSGRTATTPSPAPTMTPHILSWGSRSEHRPQWVVESPSPGEVPRPMGSRLSSAPTPLTY